MKSLPNQKGFVYNKQSLFNTNFIPIKTALFINRFYARQLLAFHIFQQRATTGRNITDL